MDRFLSATAELSTTQKATEVEELIFEDLPLYQLTEIAKERLEHFSAIQSLAFVRCNLTSLDNFPHLPKLIKLNLNDNKLTGQELSKLRQYPKLISLSLMKNKFITLDQIRVLKENKYLAQLNLYDNIVQDQKGYRDDVWRNLESLIYLDNLDRQGREIALKDQ